MQIQKLFNTWQFRFCSSMTAQILYTAYILLFKEVEIICIPKFWVKEGSWSALWKFKFGIQKLFSGNKLSVQVFNLGVETIYSHYSVYLCISL